MRLKFFFVPVIFLLLLSVQAYSVEISVSNVVVDPGASAIVSIIADDTTGIAGGDITLDYDSSIIALKSALTTDLSSPLSPVINTKIDGKVKIAMAAVEGLKAGSGALFNIEFEAKAEKGTSSIKLSQVALFDANLNDINVTTKDGSITIKEKPAHLPINLTFAEAKGNLGDDIPTSILIDDLAGVAGGDLAIKYDPAILAIVEVKPTALLNGVSVIINTNTAGKIGISMASATGIVGGKGAIIDIKFKGSAIGESEIAFETATAFDESIKDIVVNTKAGKISVSEKPCTTPIIKEHQSGSKILALQTTYNEANVHGYAYVDIWKGEFTVKTGQFLEFQEAMFSGNPTFNGTVDFITEDGKTLRDSEAKDQNSVSAHPSTDLSKYARDIWYHRIISLDALAGKKIVGAMIATESDIHGAGLFRVYVDNIQITDGKCALLQIWIDEDTIPITGKPTSNDTSFAGTAGTKDYSVSIVGETPVMPAGKLSTTWGSMKK